VQVYGSILETIRWKISDLMEMWHRRRAGKRSRTSHLSDIRLNGNSYWIIESISDRKQLKMEENSEWVQQRRRVAASDRKIVNTVPQPF
jgi:hypothetical protein